MGDVNEGIVCLDRGGVGIALHMVWLGTEDMVGQGGEVLCGSTVNGSTGHHHSRVGAFVDDMPQVCMRVVTQGAEPAMGISAKIKGGICRV